MARVRRSRSSRSAREGVERLGLVDHVELARPSYSSRLTWRHRLEAAAEAALGLAHALGHGPHLAVLGRHQHHDAVGLAEPVGAQHHAGVAVEAHDPRHGRRSVRRGRRSGGRGAGTRRTASARWWRRKSGHSTSVNTSSL